MVVDAAADPDATAGAGAPPAAGAAAEVGALTDVGATVAPGAAVVGGVAAIVVTAGSEVDPVVRPQPAPVSVAARRSEVSRPCRVMGRSVRFADEGRMGEL